MLNKYKVFFILILLTFTSCQTYYSQLVIDTIVDNKIDNVTLMKYDSPSKKMIPVIVNDVLVADENNFISLNLDLSKIGNEDDIKVVTDINRGAVVELKLLDPSNWQEIGSATIKTKGYKGYRAEKRVVTEYNSRGEPIGEKEVDGTDPVPYGETEYSDTSSIPIELKVNTNLSENQPMHALLYLKFDYTQYSPDNSNVIQGVRLNQLIKDLQKSPVVSLKVPAKKNWCIEYKVRIIKRK